MPQVELINGNSIEVLFGQIKPASVDLTVTSPPYDDLRTYNDTCTWGWYEFSAIAAGLYRVTKKGGVLVWIVKDRVINGSRTASCFEQLLHFKKIGFKVNDVMIWEKKSVMPPIKQPRYWDAFDYMYIFSKGELKTFNPIRNATKSKGKQFGTAIKRLKPKDRERTKYKKEMYTKNTFIKRNVWRAGVTKTDGRYDHPAIFPEQLAYDHIISWSNKGDTVLDCFMGSGTTGCAAVKLGRNFKGIELVPKYFNIAKSRINAVQNRSS